MPFVTSLGVGAHLESWGVAPDRITELDWWESYGCECRAHGNAAPSQHFSGRSLNDRNATLWSSLVMRSPRHTVFFSGDTGLTTEYSKFARALGHSISSCSKSAVAILRGRICIWGPRMRSKR